VNAMVEINAKCCPFMEISYNIRELLFRNNRGNSTNSNADRKIMNFTEMFYS
jgi:hypothetical protein